MTRFDETRMQTAQRVLGLGPGGCVCWVGDKIQEERGGYGIWERVGWGRGLRII